MARVIKFEGRRISVPDDATDEEVAQIIEGSSPPPSAASGQFANDASAITQSFDQPKADTNQYAVEDAKKRYLQQADGFKGGRGEALTQGSQAGLLGGYDDEIAAGMLAPIDAGIDWMKGQGFDMGRAYTRKQKMLDLQKAQRREAYPGSSIAGEVAGGLALGGTVRAAPVTGSAAASAFPRLLGTTAPGAGAVPTLAGRVPAILAAPLEGGAYGAVYGSGEAKPGERLQGAAEGAATGAALGTVLHGVGAGISKAFTKKAPPAPTTAELAADANKLFKAAKAEGVVAKPKAMNDLFAKVQTEMQDFGHDVALQPDTAVVLKRLAGSRGKPLSLTEVHNLRKIATGASRNAVKADDRAAAGKIVTKIDEFLAEPANFGANSDKGRQLLREGIETSKRKIKSEIVDDIIEKAKNQATGFENGLVIQFRQLANNKGRMRSFSQAEQAMIKSIVRRPTIHGLLRAIGMLSPNSTFGGVAAGVGIGSGVLPAIATAGVGAAARKAAGVMTNAKTAKLQKAVSSGLAGFPPLLPNRAMPFIPGGAAASTGIDQSLGIRR